MKIICEMLLTDYFKLSTGYIALVGYIKPNLDSFLTKCKAYLYVDSKKLHSINIIGEDRFSRADKNIKKGRRAVRTNDDIYEELKLLEKEKIRLVFYKE